MKTLVVREAFGLGGVDYPRGAEITDPDVIANVLDSHAAHVHATDNDVEPAKVPAKAKTAS